LQEKVTRKKYNKSDCSVFGASDINIEPERITNQIIGFLQDKVKQHNKDGIALGLSGGIDSSVVAKLASFALGPSKVNAMYLYDVFSQKQFRKNVNKIAEQLGIKLYVKDITPEINHRNGYNAVTIRKAGVSSSLNKFVVFLCHLMYPVLLKDDLFSSILKQKKSDNRFLTRLFYNQIAQAADKSFSIRHIVRREILQDYAAERNLLPIGTANRSEFLIGWFIKDGIDDLPIAPLLGLYKSQVRQLADYLQIPEEIIKAAPSPDMAKGVTDEKVIGLPYEKIDKVLYILENNLDEKTLAREGLTTRQINKINAYIKLSEWKRVGKEKECPILK
jgi:NAD+ synthase